MLTRGDGAPFTSTITPYKILRGSGPHDEQTQGQLGHVFLIFQLRRRPGLTSYLTDMTLRLAPQRMACRYCICAVLLLLGGVVDGFFVGPTRAALATAHSIDKVVHTTATGMPSQTRWRTAVDLAVTTDTAPDEVTVM